MDQETHILSIRGRITIKVFLFRLIFAIGVIFLSSSISYLANNKSIILFFRWIIPSLFSIFLVIQSIKRIHDHGRTGWNILFLFYNLYLLFTKGSKEANKWGSEPQNSIFYFHQINDAKKKQIKLHKKSNAIFLFIGTLFMLLGFILCLVSIYLQKVTSKTNPTIIVENKTNPSNSINKNQESIITSDNKPKEEKERRQNIKPKPIPVIPKPLIDKDTTIFIIANSLEESLKQIADKNIPYKKRKLLQVETIKKYFESGNSLVVEKGDSSNTDINHLNIKDFLKDLGLRNYKIEIVEKKFNSDNKITILYIKQL
jgi:hypothetical protein